MPLSLGMLGNLPQPSVHTKITNQTRLEITQWVGVGAVFTSLWSQILIKP